MRAWSILAILAAVTLSGCAGDSVEGPVEDEGDEASDIHQDNIQVPANTTPNTAPVANLSADLLKGTVPFNVTLAIEGSDPDGDNLTWSLASKGTTLAHGTELPAEHVLTILEAGNHTFLLRLSDGNATVERNLTVMAIAPAVEAFEPLEFSQEVLLSCPHCIASDATMESACVGVQAGENGLDCAWFPLNSTWAGRTWTVSGMFLPLVEFYPDCGGTGRITVGTEGSGEIPEGVGCMIVFDPVDPLVTAVLRIE